MYNLCMKNFIHKNIRRFSLDGVIYDDSFIPRLKEEYIRILEVQMKLQGFSPRLDIHPDFTIEYTGKAYNFEISIYGTYVGKKNAECLIGIDKNKPIFIQQNKSGGSSVDRESELNQK